MTLGDVCEAARQEGHNLHESDLSDAERHGRFGLTRLEAIAAGLGMKASELLAQGEGSMMPDDEPGDDSTDVQGADVQRFDR